MILYSPMVPELIWEGVEEYRPVFKEFKLGRITLVVEPLTFTQARVIRLISTDPADYLYSPYQPGKIVEFIPPKD